MVGKARNACAAEVGSGGNRVAVPWISFSHVRSPHECVEETIRKTHTTFLFIIAENSGKIAFYGWVVDNHPDLPSKEFPQMPAGQSDGGIIFHFLIAAHRFRESLIVIVEDCREGTEQARGQFRTLPVVEFHRLCFDLS